MPATAVDPLQRLQLDIAAVLKADALFAGVQVVVDRPRDAADGLVIQATVDRALAGWTEVETEAGMKAGLCIIVFMATGTAPTPNLPGPELMLVQGIRVIENTLVNEGENGTGMTAEGCAIKILNTLHQMSLGGLLLADKNALRPVLTEKGLSFDVTLTRDLGISPRPFVQRPIVHVATGSMTMTCGTEGAAIWWTSDGSLPTPVNASAALYTGPVDVSGMAGAEIRASAYLAGRRASDVTCRAV
ncbi:MAG: chitobiase/beta-hexosaminidase C-terminal domain-containing protein [Prosthecobacter sp.]